MSELFIGGNPRWLSGGAATRVAINYSSSPVRLGGSDIRVDSKWIAANKLHASCIANALLESGQAIHSGRSGYHSRPMLNMFLDESNPTVGVELETEERRDVSLAAMKDDLQSNWFHFESDSSLTKGDGRLGYELITEPLPPRVYRDIRTWVGLQNILVPWVESYEHKETGLHVHVGVEQFSDYAAALPFPDRYDRMIAGKFLAAAVYLCLVDRSFSDAVFLRRNGGYCQDNSANRFSEVAAAVDEGGVSAAAFVDMALSNVLAYNTGSWCSRVDEALTRDQDGCGTYLTSEMNGFSGHGCEINCHNQMTIEFRRGKGTLNGISIHRMVEFATHVVKYVEELLIHPDAKVSKRSFLEFVIANTNSTALRTLAQKGI